MNRKYDWAAIQDYYDQGHSLQDCKAKFGFANGGWDAAVGRGEIVPRTEKKPRSRHDTREAVRKLLESGMSQTQAAFELGLSKGTVCYHVRQLGIDGDGRFRRTTGPKSSERMTPVCRCASASSSSDSQALPGTTHGDAGFSTPVRPTRLSRSYSPRAGPATAGTCGHAS
jgi:hypothetical protein